MILANSDIIYLDNAATTFPKPESVYAVMDHFYRNFGGNAGRGANPLARKAATLIDETRALTQRWLNAPNVVFSPSATIALNLVLQGARLRTGDIVYVSPFEHNSVLRPLEHLRKTIGIEIRVLPFDKNTFECKLDEVKKLFQLEPPALVCVSQVSNVIGLILPVDEILGAAKQINPEVITVIDGAQSAGLLLPAMSLVDALVFSGHKSLYGPYGIAGVAFGGAWRPNPLIYGGTGTVSESVEMPENGSSRFEAGSQNICAIAGLNASLKWLNETGQDAIVNHTQVLTRQLFEMLLELPNVTVYLPRNRDLVFGIVSFSVEGIKPQVIETALGAKNIAVRAGFHCSPWAHEFVGTIQLGGAVRVSLGFMNSDRDISYLNAIVFDLTCLT